MKCAYCDSPIIFFTIMPEISNGIGWCSHIISETEGKCNLYHYQCADVDPLKWYYVFTEMIEGK